MCDMKTKCMLLRLHTRPTGVRCHVTFGRKECCKLAALSGHGGVRGWTIVFLSCEQKLYCCTFKISLKLLHVHVCLDWFL